jgi:NAD(P)-dependent dehydrogenase (short-subunit alcohol dehydrogenase family)
VGAKNWKEGIVRRFVEEGARVVFSDLVNEKGKALEEEIGKNGRVSTTPALLFSVPSPLIFQEKACNASC